MTLAQVANRAGSSRKEAAAMVICFRCCFDNSSEVDANSSYRLASETGRQYLLLDRQDVALRDKQGQVTDSDWTCSEVMETSGILRRSCYTRSRI